MLEAGQNFPNFTLKNQDGKTRSLSDYRGKWLVVYVYPKDDTPGCTIQGKSFTATKQKFEEMGINVVGVSADDEQSHKDFCNKYSLTVELLADPGAQLLNSAQVKQSEWNGTMYWNRTTFVVSPEGKVMKVYENVNPQGHETMLLNEIMQLQKH